VVRTLLGGDRDEINPLKEDVSMRKNSKRVPPALTHAIYSGLGLLPTESRAKFRKFKKQIFAELNLVGRLEQDIGDQIVRLEWRRQNLSTYDLAQRARARCSAIQSELIPQVRYLEFSLPLTSEPDPENPTPEELKAAHRRADKRTRIELGAALELVELGDVVTFEYLDKRLSVEDRLDAMIARLYKKLAYVRAIKSMPPPGLPVPATPLLENLSRSRETNRRSF
jgi:hypothetical protein